MNVHSCIHTLLKISMTYRNLIQCDTSVNCSEVATVMMMMMVILHIQLLIGFIVQEP